MNSYIKEISIEYLIFLLLCSFCIAILLQSPKHKWLDIKSSRLIIVLILILFLLISIFYIIDLIYISNDIKESNYVTQQITFSAEPDYNLGTAELFSKRYLYCTDENGNELRLWLSKDIDLNNSDFSGTITYGSDSKCVILIEIQYE
jgi:hypothetical protein